MNIIISLIHRHLFPFNPQVVLDKLPPPTPNPISDSTQTPVTPLHCTTQMIRTLILTTVRNLTYLATMLSNSDYLLSTRTDIQKIYLKGSLARINSGALAEDYLTSIHQAELQCAACRKGTARIV